MPLLRRLLPSRQSLGLGISTLFLLVITTGLLGCDSSGEDSASPASLGSEERPLRVMLVPADGGTEQGTIADFEPIFSAITDSAGIHFDVKVGQSYNAVIEAMTLAKVDIAFFGPVSYHAAKEQGAAELLAVSVTNGESVYHSGLFARRDSGIERIQDVRGRSVAFGDINSTSSFNYPVAMLLAAGINPAEDLSMIVMAGSHASSLEAMVVGRVDVAAASYVSFEKAVENGTLDPQVVIPIARSEPIPNPPLALHTDLPEELKTTLRAAFNTIHEAPGITPDMLRGYGGKRVDRYDAEVREEVFERAIEQLEPVTDELRGEMLRLASAGGGG